MEFGEWLCTAVVKAVVHRHVVFSVPKIIRRYFLYDRKLLSELSRCGWDALKAVCAVGVRDKTAIPGTAIAIQTFGDFLGIILTFIFWFRTGASTAAACFPFLRPWIPKRWKCCLVTLRVILNTTRCEPLKLPYHACLLRHRK